MKRLAMAFFGTALILSSLAAQAADATFATRNGAIFQLFLNGRPVNGPGSNTVRLEHLPAGQHRLEFRVPGRRGALIYQTNVLLKRGFETNYILTLPGRNPDFKLKKINMVPLRPVACSTCPPQPNYNYNGGYDDYDGYNQDPNGYNQPNNAYPPAPNNLMTRFDVDLLAESISRRNFESSKLEIAKQAIEQNTIYAEDVKRLAGLFAFESSRVAFAKFAYPRLADPQNFYRVYDAFQFDSSISEMQRWLK